MTHLRILSLIGVLAAVGCAPEAPPPAPHAEFIVAAADSVFWVRSDEDGIRVRGAPMLLAQVGGRFSELYLTDDDLSFYDAVFVGQRLFKRDLISGDSTELFADTLIPALARSYAAANPDERPLQAEEQGNEQPRTTATAELELLDVHGPWLSFRYRSDVVVVGGHSAHGLRAGVVDLRTGAPGTLEGLFGRRLATRLAEEGRAQWGVIRDSLARAAASAESRVQDAVERLAFDARSFGLQAVGREPQVQFTLTQRNGSVFSSPIPLPPVPVAEPSWWAGVREGIPEVNSAGERRWPRPRYELLARDASAGARSGLILRDLKGSEWRLASVPVPIQRVMWLDGPAISDAARRALLRAFNESAFYSGETRAVSRPSRARVPLLRFVSAAAVEPSVPRRTPLARPRSLR